MKTTHATLFGSIFLLMFASLSFAQQAVTMAEIQADYEAQKYQEVVRKTNTALNLKGNLAVGFDRAELQVLRGEAYLRLKQNPNAVTAFNAAVKETTDSTKGGLWTATAVLIGKSPGGRYVPKQPPGTGAAAGGATRGGPIDIVEPATRKEAFAALFNDEYKLAQTKIQASLKQTSLNPLVESLKTAAGLRNMELAATGKDDTVKGVIDQLGSRAAALMLEEVKKMSTEVEKISTTANQTSTDAYVNPARGSSVVSTQKRGLTTTDSRTLTSVVQMTGQIGKAADELAAAVGSDQQFSAVKEDSARLSQRAYDVLNANYAGNATNVRTQPVPRGNPGTTTPPR